MHLKDKKFVRLFHLTLVHVSDSRFKFSLRAQLTNRAAFSVSIQSALPAPCFGSGLVTISLALAATSATLAITI